MDEMTMPAINADKMEPIKFAVPAKLLADAEAIAEAEGWKMAELHRGLWQMGLTKKAEESNKLLINRRLRTRPTIDQLAEVLGALADDPTNAELQQQAKELAKRVKEEKR
jgi:hypothetical protein